MDRANATALTHAKQLLILSGTNIMTCMYAFDELLTIISLALFKYLQIILPFIFLYCSYIGKGDGITISVWNHKKIHKKQGGGFLGCVRIMSNTIQRLKDTGCK